MAIDQVSQAYNASYETITSGNVQTNEHPADSQSARKPGVVDVVSLSVGAQYLFKIGNLSDVTQENLKPLTTRSGLMIDAETATTYMENRYNYALESRAFDFAQKDAYLAGMEKLNQESGGLLHGAAISNDLSTITTTAGSPHPQADQIRHFLGEHADEWNSLHSPKSFPSFKEWMAANGS